MTTTEMGEYVVGAYLKLEKECDFVDFNMRPLAAVSPASGSSGS